MEEKVDKQRAKKIAIMSAIILTIIIDVFFVMYVFSNQRPCTVGTISPENQNAAAQNNKFEQYFGDKVSAANVKSLMSLIRTNNVTAKNGEEEKEITVYYGTSESTPNTISTTVEANKTYNVYVDERDDDSYYPSGYIKKIIITENP